MTEQRGGAGPDARSRALLADLVNELAAAPSGVAFIAGCLDRVVETWNLAEARAVIDDPVLGLQLFNAGRRLFPPDDLPSRVLALGTGIHTEPALCEEVERADIDAIAQLCELALKLDRLRYESLHDSLTGLYNRRAFDEYLAAAISRSVRYGWRFGLVIIDLDGFKSINDRVGHQGGDAALRRVGEQLRQSVRSGDIAARVGGDEFGLLVPVEGPSSLEAILDRLHGTGGFAEAGEVAWTAGIAMCPDEAATIDELYRVADRRLYEAKAIGNPHASASAPASSGEG